MAVDKNVLAPLSSVLETLELLIAQANAYEQVLPPDNYPARAAVAALGELARQALNEAADLIILMETVESSEHNLSPRELEVLNLASKGLTNKEIAYRLGISDRTVQFHMNSVFNKTGTNSRTEVVALAVKNEWVLP